MPLVSSCELIYDLDITNKNSEKIMLGKFFEAEVEGTKLIAYSARPISMDDLNRVGGMIGEFFHNPVRLFTQALANISVRVVGDRTYMDEFIREFTMAKQIEQAQNNGPVSAPDVINIQKDMQIDENSDPFEIIKPVEGGSIGLLVPKLPEEFNAE